MEFLNCKHLFGSLDKSALAVYNHLILKLIF